MAKTKEDKSRVTLEVDGKQAINQLGKLEMEAKELAIDMKEAKKGTTEYINASKRMKEVKAEIKGVRTELGLTGMTMTQLSRYQRELRKEISNTATQGTADYRRLQTELTKVNQTLAQQRKELNGTAGFFNKLSGSLKAMAASAGIFLSVGAVIEGIRKVVGGSADLSDAYADVQKTTELTNMEMDQLVERFKTFNTRTPRAELLALADEAGKMGKRGVAAVADYVEQTNELTTALGKDLGEDAGLKVAKMAERFNVSMRQIGSGINAVADNTKAKAGFITEFLARLAGTGNEVGIAAGDILGYGAAIDEMGLNVEMSSTALNGFLIEFTKNTEFYGKAAGFAQGELSKLVGEQGTNQGFLAFLERLRAANPLAADFLKKLEEIGIDGQRGSQVFLAIAQNVDQLRDRQALANEEIAKGTSLTEEYNKKNVTLAGNLQILWENMSNLFINGRIMTGLNNIVSKWVEWSNVSLSDKLEDERIEFNKLWIQIQTTNEESEERVRLINEMKKLYPGYLSQIDAEFISNENLAGAVKRVNDMLVNKIILQRKDEDLQEQRVKRADAIEKLMKTEDFVRQRMTEISEKYNISIKEGLSLTEAATQLGKDAGIWDLGRAGRESKTYSLAIEDITKLTNEVNMLEDEGNTLMEEKASLMKRLGMEATKALAPVSSLSRASMFGSTESASANETPEEKKAREAAEKAAQSKAESEKAKLKKQLEDMEAEWVKYQENIAKLQREFVLKGMPLQEEALERNNDFYRIQEEELKKFWDEKLLTIEQYEMEQAKLTSLRLEEEARIKEEFKLKEDEKKLLEEQKLAEEKALDAQAYFEATASDTDIEIARVEAHYDTLFAMAEKNGWDMNALERKKAQEIQKIKDDAWKKEYAKELAKVSDKLEPYMEFGEGAIGILSSIDAFTSESNKFAKETAIFKALVASGQAIASMIAAFSVSSPNPLLLAAKLAAGIGVIMTNIATAKRTIDSANEPTPPSEKAIPVRGRSNATPKKSFFWGGPTGDQSLGSGDQYGAFVGAVHANEYVVPSITTTDPVVANLLPAIEQVRQDNQKGFTNTTGAGTGVMTLDAESKALLRAIAGGFDKMQNKKVILVTSELEEHEEERVMLENRYSG